MTEGDLIPASARTTPLTEDELIPAKPLLRGFAARVSKQTKAQVVLATQTDASYAWQGSFIHPLQPLENRHQRATREAVWAEPDPEKHQQASGKALGDYFGFAVGSLIYLVLTEQMPACYRQAGRRTMALVTLVAMGIVVLLGGMAR